LDIHKIQKNINLSVQSDRNSDLTLILIIMKIK